MRVEVGEHLALRDGGAEQPRADEPLAPLGADDAHPPQLLHVILERLLQVRCKHTDETVKSVESTREKRYQQSAGGGNDLEDGFLMLLQKKATVSFSAKALSEHAAGVPLWECVPRGFIASVLKSAGSVSQTCKRHQLLQEQE